ncbi:hypothetical protein EBR21_07155 [bacterium]|nr:hypothetical protein [bacterium]
MSALFAASNEGSLKTGKWLWRSCFATSQGMMRILFMKDQRASRSFLLASTLLSFCVACSNSSSRTGRSAFPAPGLVALAIGNPQPESPVVKAPSGFSNITYYRVMVQGILLGSAVVGRSSTEPSQDLVLDLKIAHRLGYAPLLSNIKLTAHSENGILGNAEQNITVHHLDSMVFNSESEWKKDGGESLRVTKGNPEEHLLRLGLRPSSGRTKISMTDKNLRFSLPFYANKKSDGSSDPVVLNPLNGLAIAASDVVVKYATDGVADELSLPWFGGTTLQFVRDTAEMIESLPSQMSQTPLELAWFSNPSTIQDDLRTLQGIALNAVQFSKNSEKLIRKEFPQLPYLFHRKLFNFAKLSERLAFELSMGQARKLSSEQTLMQIGWVVRNRLAEDHRELPRSLVNSPELEVLADDAKKWQWAKIITNMLTQTSEELSQVLAIEDSQKVNVSVKMGARNLARGSVVKGMLRSGRLLMRHQVESAGNQPLKPSSYVALPTALVQPLKVAMNQTSQQSPALKATAKQTSVPPFEFVNGQSFAKGDFPTLSPLCESYQGRIGLDLGSSHNELFSSSIVRGVWDESTRVQLIRQFARRASANPACREIVLRAPGDLTTAAQSELESFRRDILQTEMEFQISVGSNRTVRLVPGSYELVISSLVNGSILGKREIIIPQGHENLVLNLQL